MTKENTPSQRALDHASQLAGVTIIMGEPVSAPLYQSIIHHALTLDQLWERCPGLAPKTKGGLFAEELMRRWEGSGMTWMTVAAQMIDENWGEK